MFQFWPLKRTDYPSSVPYQSHEQWKLGTDFTLAFGVLNYRSAEEAINLEENVKHLNISHSSIGHVQFDKLVTKWGNYYKISANMLNIKAPHRAFVNINFHKSIADEDLPSLEMIMSSETNSYGVTLADFQDGKRITFDKAKGFLWTAAQPKKVVKMMSKGTCSDIGFYDCIYSNLIQQDFDNCPRKCFPISTSGNASPICETAEEYECSHEVTKKVKKNSNCIPNCNQIDYSLENEYQEYLEDPNAKRNITFAYKISNPKMKVEEEYLVHDFVGMLGSIGGTLGLFIGFSFLGGLTNLLSHIQSFWKKMRLKRKIDLKHDIIKVQPSLNHNDMNISDVIAKLNETELKIFMLDKKCEEMFAKLKMGQKVLEKT